jgi:hypothetical protein
MAITQLKIIETQEGYRTKTGYHTGYAILTNGRGDYFVLQESGVKKITVKGIIRLREKTLDK